MKKISILGYEADVAESFLERAKGLIGCRAPAPGEYRAMLIKKCNAIHTFFMKFPIDAIFLDKNGNVVKTVRNIPPSRFLVWGGFRAKSVLEISSRK